jgi:hypothetical protein
MMYDTCGRTRENWAVLELAERQIAFLDEQAS